MLCVYGGSQNTTLNGKQHYTPFRHSTTWLNATVGNKWRGHFFVGYTKNMGTTASLANATCYGMGLNIDQLFSTNVAFSYNLPHWQVGLEYMPATAWYGTTELATGKVRDTHAVTNHRFVAIVMYYF